MKAWRLSLAAALLIAATLPALAGRTCEAKAPTAISVQRAMELAERTAQALDASGAEVVVIGRAGQDLSRWQLRWSHLGLAYRDGSVWRVVHKLNQCGTAQAALYRQGLAEFFLDDPFEYRAAVAVLAPEVQARLRPLLADNAWIARLHSPAYNMVAYPWSQTYQQSNQWLIETIALAQEPRADTRERAQAWLKVQGYEPTTLRIGTMERLGARISAANVSFDDHPNDKRFGGRIETVTADSVFAWLERSRLGARMREWR